MVHYRSLRDHTEFLLFNVMRDEVLESEAYEDFDPDTARDMLKHIQEYAETKMAPSFGAGDREGLKLNPDTGEVTLPDDLREALRDHISSDWLKLDLPDDFIGYHPPPSLRWAMTEYILGANPAVAMCTQLIPQVVRLLHE